MNEDKFVVVDENGKRQTGPLSFPEAQKKRKETGGEIEQVAQPAQEPAMKVFMDRLVILTIICVIIGFAFHIEFYLIGFAWLLGFVSLGLFIALRRL